MKGNSYEIERKDYLYDSMTDNKKDIARQLSPARIILPVVIGLAVIVWLFVKDINKNVLNEIDFTWKSVYWITVAILLTGCRTFFYMARIRTLTGNDLSFKQSFRVVMLWEFTSAITPSSVGGTALAVIFLNREGINTGRSTAVVLATAFLDELYFVIMLPAVLLITGFSSIFISAIQGTGTGILNNLVLVAVIAYLVVLAWVLFSGYGLFVNPSLIKKIIVSIFRLPVLRRWKSSAEKAGNDMIESANVLKNESGMFWVKSIAYTFISWTARYFVVNAILLAFFSIGHQMLLFARQLILWNMMIISPTPGGSGFAEVILGKYISDLLPGNSAEAAGVALAMAIIWRLISYYPFLVAGALIVPGWIQRKFVKAA